MISGFDQDTFVSFVFGTRTEFCSSVCNTSLHAAMRASFFCCPEFSTVSISHTLNTSKSIVTPTKCCYFDMDVEMKRPTVIAHEHVRDAVSAFNIGRYIPEKLFVW